MSDVCDRPLALTVKDRFDTTAQARSALARSEANIDGNLSAFVPAAIVSKLLKSQLAWAALRQPLSFFDKTYYFWTDCIVDELQHLENPRTKPTGTKPAEEFAGSLKGFWHKHFFQPNLYGPNLLNEIASRARFDRLWYTGFCRQNEIPPILRDDNAIAANSGLIATLLSWGRLISVREDKQRVPRAE